MHLYAVLGQGFPWGSPAVLSSLRHLSAVPGAESSCGCAGRDTVAGKEKQVLSWGAAMNCGSQLADALPLLLGTVWPCASSTVAPALWLALPSSPSWASWQRSRVCPSPRWLSQVSEDPSGMGLWRCCHLSPQLLGNACSCRFPSLALCLQKAGRNECK